MSATRIHHVNFVVTDLDDAIPRFRQMLNLAPFEIVDHPPRGARVARSRLGESWLVLVQPTDCASVPGRFLAKHGEGFFLLSVGAPYDKSLQWRDGILDWRVSDLGEIHGAHFQLTRDNF